MRLGFQVVLARSSTGSVDKGPHACGERQARAHGIAQHGRRGANLAASLSWNRHVHRLQQQITGDFILDACQKLAQDADARGSDAATSARMYTFFEHLHFECPDEVATQRCGAPQLLVVAAFGVQADDEARCAEARRERGNVGRQVRTAALLASLDHHHAARARNALSIECGDGSERSKDGVAIVGAAAAVQPAVANDRFPGTQPFVPAGKFRLLVQMAVQQHTVIHLAGQIDEEQGCAALDAHDLDRHAGKGLHTAPVRHQLDCGFHVAVLFPVRIEQRGLIGDAHVVAKLGQDRIAPLPFHVLPHRIFVKRDCHDYSMPYET